MMKENLIQVICGPGKGKTASALGRGVTALLKGKTVIMVQFLKGSMETEGMEIVKRLEPEFKLFRFEKSPIFFDQLSEEEKELLDRRFQIVIRDQGLTGITVTYYKKDSLKEGGSYETITGHLEKFSSYDRTIVLGGTVIALDDISAIEGELFEAGEADLTS